MTEYEQFQLQRDQIRKRLCKYTSKAFQTLPPMNKPRFLAIGCGSGISTIELSKLCNGEIIEIDIDQSALDKSINTIRKV